MGDWQQARRLLYWHDSSQNTAGIDTLAGFEGFDVNKRYSGKHLRLNSLSVASTMDNQTVLRLYEVPILLLLECLQEKLAVNLPAASDIGTLRSIELGLP